jgi:hypothetical protein
MVKEWVQRGVYEESKKRGREKKLLEVEKKHK